MLTFSGMGAAAASSASFFFSASSAILIFNLRGNQISTEAYLRRFSCVELLEKILSALWTMVYPVDFFNRQKTTLVAMLP